MHKVTASPGVGEVLDLTGIHRECLRNEGVVQGDMGLTGSWGLRRGALLKVEWKPPACPPLSAQQGRKCWLTRQETAEA